MEEKLDALRRGAHVAGMSVAVTDRQKILYKKGFGVDSAERPQVTAGPDSMYRIASISKVITGITILKLAEEGLLELDAPVKRYVPWLKLTRSGAEGRMTLRHLLSHTSGLPKEYTPIGSRDEASLEKSLMEELPKAEMHAMPGDGCYLYSNLGIRLASYAAQSVSGRPFSQLARTFALEPLGMSRTTYDLCVAATYPLSLPHLLRGGQPEVEHLIKENAARYAAGGLYSNAEDLCCLARFLLNEGRNDTGQPVLKPESVSLLFEKQAEVGEGGQVSYGITLQHYRSKSGRMFYGHLGDNSPYMGALWTEPVSGYGMAVLINTAVPGLCTEAVEQIFSELNRKEQRK